MNLHPTNTLLNRLRERGIQWPDVEADLSEPESVTPVKGHDNRQRIAGRRWQGYVLPDRNGDPDSWVVIGVRDRQRASAEDRLGHEPVVGIETRLSIPRSRGGNGRRWPTTYDELCGRIKEEGFGVDQGSTHLGIYRGGKRLATLPVTPSDWRSLLNTCHQLRRIGIDVSRRLAIAILAMLWLTDFLTRSGVSGWS